MNKRITAIICFVCTAFAAGLVLYNRTPERFRGQYSEYIVYENRTSKTVLFYKSQRYYLGPALQSGQYSDIDFLLKPAKISEQCLVMEYIALPRINIPMFTCNGFKFVRSIQRKGPEGARIFNVYCAGADICKFFSKSKVAIRVVTDWKGLISTIELNPYTDQSETFTSKSTNRLFSGA